MNIRTAILKAADHIEQNPQLFNFCENRGPNDCKTPGCFLGWVSFFMDIKIEDAVSSCKDILGIEFNDLHTRMWALKREKKLDATWNLSAQGCAIHARAYADKYHPVETKLPASVTDIFKMQPEALYKVLSR